MSSTARRPPTTNRRTVEDEILRKLSELDSLLEGSSDPRVRQWGSNMVVELQATVSSVLQRRERGSGMNGVADHES